MKMIIAKRTISMEMINVYKKYLITSELSEPINFDRGIIVVYFDDYEIVDIITTPKHNGKIVDYADYLYKCDNILDQVKNTYQPNELVSYVDNPIIQLVKNRIDFNLFNQSRLYKK